MLHQKQYACLYNYKRLQMFISYHIRQQIQGLIWSKITIRDTVMWNTHRIVNDEAVQ